MHWIFKETPLHENLFINIINKYNLCVLCERELTCIYWIKYTNDSPYGRGSIYSSGQPGRPWEHVRGSPAVLTPLCLRTAPDWLSRGYSHSGGGCGGAMNSQILNACSTVLTTAMMTMTVMCHHSWSAVSHYQNGSSDVYQASWLCWWGVTYKLYVY